MLACFLFIHSFIFALCAVIVLRFQIPNQPTLIDFTVWFHIERTFALSLHREARGPRDLSVLFWVFILWFVCVWRGLLATPPLTLHPPPTTHTHTHPSQYWGLCGTVVNHSPVFYLLSVYGTIDFGARLISLFLEIL